MSPELEAESRRQGFHLFTSVALLGLDGFQKRPTRVALGAMSLTSASHVPVKFSAGARDNPVMFPPGRARLWTRPEPTGSNATKTTGVVVVTRLAAAAAAAGSRQQKPTPLCGTDQVEVLGRVAGCLR